MLGIYVLEMRPTQAFPFDGWIACCYSSTCRPCCQKVGHVYTSKEKAMTFWKLLAGLFYSQGSQIQGQTFNESSACEGFVPNSLKYGHKKESLFTLFKLG